MMNFLKKLTGPRPKRGNGDIVRFSTGRERPKDVQDSLMMNPSGEGGSYPLPRSTQPAKDDLTQSDAVPDGQPAQNNEVSPPGAHGASDNQVLADNSDTVVSISQLESDAVVVATELSIAGCDDMPATEVTAQPESDEKRSTRQSAATPCVSNETMAADTDKELTESVHFDLFIIVGDSYESQQNANKLAKILVTFCARCCSDRLTVFPELQLGGNRLKNLRNGLKHSTYRLIFIDDGFEESHFVRFETDAALMEMIVNRDQSIIPVKAHSQILIPSLLRMFKPLDVSRLLKGKRLEDIDIELMTEADIEKPLVEGIVRMLNRSGSVRQSNSEPSLGAVSKHSELLQRHYKYLSEWMDPDGGLIPALYSADVINRREMETISAEKTSFDRNEHLVRTLQRKSEANFRKFIEVLQTEEQSHIAEQLGFGASQASKRAVNR